MLQNIRISNIQALDTPLQIKSELPSNPEIDKYVMEVRNNIENVLSGKDSRIISIVGPCSIHDPKAALEYAKYLKEKHTEHKDSQIIVMRTYFSKPRTTTGWKGLVYDPDLNGSYDIAKGLRLARKTLLEISRLGVACSMEHLDTISPQYFDDLLVWGAIGARTTESQVHRELASGISTPIGFKNGTGGSLDLAVNAVEASTKPHHFMGCDPQGRISSITTKGNPFCHVILRGGSNGPNYQKEFVETVCAKLRSRSLDENVIIDFSHGNSGKNYKNQITVAKNVCQQIADGNISISGIMIESNLVEGKQNLSNSVLSFGQSITDCCIGLDETNRILDMLSNAYTSRKLKG
jgi:3-deoxy-7-phosphoheptulonate synthase